MANEKKVPKLSDVALEVLEFVKKKGSVIFSEVKKEIPAANPSHLNALKTRGYLTTEKVEVETVKVVKSTVNKYFAA